MGHRPRARRTGAALVFVVAALVAAEPAVAALEGDPIGVAALPRAETVFPVVGPVGWGQGDAHYGADRGGRMHEGQDLFAPAGTPLLAVRSSEVLQTGDDGGRGNYVAIYDPVADETYLYLHMLEPARVRPGQRVEAGRRLGSVGCTGSCWGDHLHFEVRAGRGTERPPRSPLRLLRAAQPD